MNKMQKEKVRQLRVRGDSYADIGIATGLSVGTIKAYCSRNDVKLNQPEQEGKCERCGKALLQQVNAPAKRFCSFECRNNWWRSNRDKKEALVAITDSAALEKERDTLQEECEIVKELMRKMVQENARIVQDQTDYKAKESSMAERYEKASKRLAKVGKDIAARNAKRSELESFLRLLDGRDDLLKEFDEALRLGIVHQMKVHSDNEFTFVLKDGREITLLIPKKQACWSYLH